MFLKKNHLLRSWGCLSLLTWIGGLTLSLLTKTGALICSMKFLSPEFALYLFKSTIQPYMEYCCHIWDEAPSCYLELLDKLQKHICRTVGPLLTASLEPLAHCQNIANLSFFLNFYLAAPQPNLGH